MNFAKAYCLLALEGSKDDVLFCEDSWKIPIFLKKALCFKKYIFQNPSHKSCYFFLNFRYGDLCGDGHLRELRLATGSHLLGHVGGTTTIPLEGFPHAMEIYDPKDETISVLVDDDHFLQGGKSFCKNVPKTTVRERKINWQKKSCWSLIEVIQIYVCIVYGLLRFEVSHFSLESLDAHRACGYL